MNDIAYAQIKEVAVGLPDADHFSTATAVERAILGDAKRATSWIVLALTIDPDDLTTQCNPAAVYPIVGKPDTAMHILKAYMQRVADDVI